MKNPDNPSPADLLAPIISSEQFGDVSKLRRRKKHQYPSVIQQFKGLRGELTDLDIFLFDTEHLTAGYTAQALEAAKAVQEPAGECG